MRNKIKQLMNKEEGFTLVELLAVIVILGLIVAIAIPSIGSILEDAESNTDEATATLIEDAARLYEINEEVTIGDVEADGVSVDELVANGYLDLRGDDADQPTGYVIKTTTTNATSGDVESIEYEYKE